MKKTVIALLASAFVLGGCSRISTGEVGVRINASKEIEGKELMPGSFNQTLIGEVLTFPVKDITVNLDNKTPLTADNSALADFDITAVYGINPTSVAELYSTKARGFHAYDEKEKDWYLMYNYITTLLNNASYKAVRQYKALEVADNRQKIEHEILSIVTDQLRAEKLDAAITVTVVQVRNVQPNAEILKSANEFVRAQNELRQKEVEVKTAQLEADKQKALAANGPQTIAYMNAQAAITIAEAVKAGKVQTLLIPHGMTVLNIPQK